MSQIFDLVVIGGGPGGYVAAIKAAQLGMKVACVEKRGALGGTCLNVGCIPSKALLHSSHLYETAKEHGKEHGIIGDIKLDLKAMLGRKDKVVQDLTKGIEGLFAKNKVTYFKGEGIILAPGKVQVKESKESKEELSTKYILIATGSEVTPLSGIAIDEDRIVSSTGALELSKVPKKLAVIGGGVIGLELGSVWRRLGAEVVVIEYLDRILPTMDGEISKAFQKILHKQGIEFKLSSKVTEAKTEGKHVIVKINPASNNNSEKEEILKVDVVLVAIGRRPYTKGLGLEKIGVKCDERGFIEVNAHFETSVAGIYAIGDVIKGPMLAHKAEEDGIAAVEIMAGQAGHVNYDLVPSVVYTFPEVASIGKTEEQLKKEGIEYSIGKFPFLANSRARANGETDGLVKMLTCKKTDTILGVHIIGPQAGTVLGEAVMAMEYKATAEDVARSWHSHPDLQEALKEAALAAFFKPLHI